MDETEDIDTLQSRMQQCMAQLDVSGWNEDNIQLYFEETARLLARINALCIPPAVSQSIQPQLVASNSQDEANQRCFHDLSTLPIYYNNVRSITNKRNIAAKIDLSVYKILCFTETWLSSKEQSGIYFPSRFNVYLL